MIDGLEFDNGVIEAEIAGAPSPAPRRAPAASSASHSGCRATCGPTTRSTSGRPTGAPTIRCGATTRRSTSRIRTWPWFRLRKETPEKYESYVDLVPGEWTKVKIEVRGAQARLFVHDQPQPTLIVNDVKTGADGEGRDRAVAGRRHGGALPEPHGDAGVERHRLRGGGRRGGGGEGGRGGNEEGGIGGGGWEGEEWRVRSGKSVE